MCLLHGSCMPQQDEPDSRQIVDGLFSGVQISAQRCLTSTDWARLARLLSVTESCGLGASAALAAAQGAGGVPAGGGTPDAALPGV